MPKYFFDIRDRIDCSDDIGAELPDVAAALKLACASIGEILKDASRAGSSTQCTATVRNESGAKLFTATALLTIEMA